MRSSPDFLQKVQPSEAKVTFGSLYPIQNEASRNLDRYSPKRCCTRITLASKLGAWGGSPKSCSPWRSWLPERRKMLLAADQPWVIRCAPSPLMIAVEKEVPHQSAQPLTFCSPLGKSGEI